MKHPLAIFLIVLAAYTLTAGGHLYSPDEEVLFRMTRALATHGELAIDPLPESFGTRPPAVARADKKEYGQYGIGQPLLAVPLYWAGRAMTPFAKPGAWQRLSPNPFNEVDGEVIPRFFCSWFNVILGAALAVLLYGVCLEILRGTGVSPVILRGTGVSPVILRGTGVSPVILRGTGVSPVILRGTGVSPVIQNPEDHGRAAHATIKNAPVWAALLYALGSLAWPHSRAFFSESCAAFFILLAWYCLLRARRGRLAPWCALAGAAAGYAALVRMDSVLAFPALAILLLQCGTGVSPVISATEDKINHGRAARATFNFGRAARAIIAFCIPALICGAVLLGLNRLHFGGATQTGYTNRPEGIAFSTPIAAGLYGFLFSSGKGLFFFSPALALSFFGWRHLARSGRRVSPALIWAVGAAIAVPLAVQSTWQNWPGGWCWGPRHIFLIHPFLALPIAAWLAARRGTGTRVIAGLFLIAGIAVQLLGSSQDFILYYRHFFRTPGENFNLMLLDDYDRKFWEQYYQLGFRLNPEMPFQRVSLCTPRPIQDSIYIPQISVWNGFPKMWSEGFRDNFWLRVMAYGLGGKVAEKDAG